MPEEVVRLKIVIDGAEGNSAVDDLLGRLNGGGGGGGGTAPTPGGRAPRNTQPGADAGGGGMLAGVMREFTSALKTAAPGIAAVALLKEPLQTFKDGIGTFVNMLSSGVEGGLDKLGILSYEQSAHVRAQPTARRQLAEFGAETLGTASDAQMRAMYDLYLQMETMRETGRGRARGIAAQAEFDNGAGNPYIRFQR